MHIDNAKRVFLTTALLIVFFTVTTGATYRPADENPASLRRISANAVAFSPQEDGKIPLNASPSRLSVNLGFSYYEAQGRYSMPRLIEHRDTDRLHFLWASQQVAPGGEDDRYLFRSCAGLSTCNLLGGGPLTGSVSDNGSLDVHTNTYFIVAAGNQRSVDDEFARAYYDLSWTDPPGEPMYFFIDEGPTDRYGGAYPGQAGIGPDNPNLWPRIEQQIGTETMLHMVTCEKNPGDVLGATLYTMSYYRRVGDYGSGVWSDQRIIDSTNIGEPAMVASPNSDHVAIVWMAPCESLVYTLGDERNIWANDVYYVKSSMQGYDWMNADPDISLAQLVQSGTLEGYNLTYYDATAPEDWDEGEFGYCEVQGLFDSDWNLHIIWGTRVFLDEDTPTRRDGAIYHWSENNPTISTVYRAPDFRNEPEAYCVEISGNNQGIGKMSLAQCRGNGNLYVTFTGWGIEGDPCSDYDVVSPSHYGAGNATGYLYMTASWDGQFWGYPERVTTTPATTSGCSPDGSQGPQCHSEEYGSLVRYGRLAQCGEYAGQEVLDMLYIDDHAPGAIEYVAGPPTYTPNPVNWLTVPCRDPLPKSCYYDNAGRGLGHCYSDEALWVEPGGYTSFTLVMNNPCLLDNDFSIDISYDNGSGWINSSPMSSTIPAQGEEEIDLTFTCPSGAPDPSIWQATITVVHEGDDSPRLIPVCLLVASHTPLQQSAVLATTCKRLNIFGDGGVGGDTPDASLDFIDDCDTFNLPQTDPRTYLYDGGPVICRVDGADTLRFTSYYYDWPSSDALHQIEAMYIDSTTYSGYSYAETEFVTGDTAVGCVAEVYLPKHNDSCDFVFLVYRFYNRSGGSLNDVMLGAVFDWDVPSDTLTRNGSDFDVTRTLMYQFGAEYDMTGAPGCGQIETDRLAGVAVFEPQTPHAMMTIDNATWMSSLGSGGPLPPGPTYQLMRDQSGFTRWDSPSPDSQYVDLTTMVVFGEYDLAPTDTVLAFFALVTTKDGMSDFLSEVDKATAWAHAFIPPGCCDVAGDANSDLACNVGDAVFLINYAFKGGPAPNCLDAGDANVDCAVNVGDAVYVINYAFKGGPAPNCGCVGAK